MGGWDLGLQHLGEAQKLIRSMLSGKVCNMAAVRQQTVFWESLRRIQFYFRLSELLSTQRRPVRGYMEDVNQQPSIEFYASCRLVHSAVDSPLHIEFKHCKTPARCCICAYANQCLQTSQARNIITFVHCFCGAQSQMLTAVNDPKLLNAALGPGCSDWLSRVHSVVRAPHPTRPDYTDSLFDLLRLIRNLESHHETHRGSILAVLGPYPYGYERCVCFPCHRGGCFQFCE